MTGHLIATVEGVEHKIPQAWVSGFCHPRGSHGLRPLTTEDAVRWWHEQWKLGGSDVHKRAVGLD